MMAEALTTPEKTVTDYTRRLKEAGLISTGARGVNAPEMTPLDAARLLIALLSSSSATHCVERVRRFGCIEHHPLSMRNSHLWREDIAPKDIREDLDGKNLENIIATLIALPSKIGFSEATSWFLQNSFKLQITDFEIKAEFIFWVLSETRLQKEKVLRLIGRMWDVTGDVLKPPEGFEAIKGGIRSTRAVHGTTILSIGHSLAETT